MGLNLNSKPSLAVIDDAVDELLLNLSLTTGNIVEEKRIVEVSNDRGIVLTMHPEERYFEFDREKYNEITINHPEVKPLVDYLLDSSNGWSLL